MGMMVGEGMSGHGMSEWPNGETWGYFFDGVSGWRLSLCARRASMAFLFAFMRGSVSGWFADADACFVDEALFWGGSSVSIVAAEFRGF